MKVTRRSIYSGTVRVKDLPITHQQIIEYEKGKDISKCMPHLSHADMMFFVSGITDEDWDETPVNTISRRE